MLGSVYHNLSQPCSYVPTLRVGAVRPGQVVTTGRERGNTNTFTETCNFILGVKLRTVTPQIGAKDQTGQYAVEGLK